MRLHAWSFAMHAAVRGNAFERHSKLYAAVGTKIGLCTCRETEATAAKSADCNDAGQQSLQGPCVSEEGQDGLGTCSVGNSLQPVLQPLPPKEMRFLYSGQEAAQSPSQGRIWDGAFMPAAVLNELVPQSGYGKPRVRELPYVLCQFSPSSPPCDADVYKEHNHKGWRVFQHMLGTCLHMHASCI
jgi:hypothetical protein